MAIVPLAFAVKSFSHYPLTTEQARVAPATPQPSCAWPS